jgi:malonyl-CoA/methylmalonyl-CoA synthetase
MSDIATAPRPAVPTTLSGIVADAFARVPDAPFLRTVDGTVSTYRDADRRSLQLRVALNRAGVQPGDRVAVQVEKSPFSLMLYLACLRAGAVYVPLNTGYTEPEVEYVVNDVEPAVIVRDPRRAVGPARCPTFTADEHGAGTLLDTVDRVEREGADSPDPARRPTDPAAILYTSGTTGRPKGAVLSQANLATNATALCEVWRFTPDDVLLHALPLFHTHGLFVATNCTIASGSSLILLPRFDIDQVFDWLPSSSVFMGIPTFYTRLLADDRLTPQVCSSLRLFTSGSAPLPASAHRAFSERTGHAIVERYGMTETSILTSNPLGAERPGTVGRALPGVELRVSGDQVGDAAGSTAGVGGAGAIEVRGPNVFEGYWRRPELRDSEFTPDGYFMTGDLGTIDEDGYLTIVGRSKDVIISGGFNVYPKEVEDVLSVIDGVLECAVVGLSDPDLGERVTAVVVRRDGTAITEAAIRTAARERLASYKVPKSVHFVDALPRNTMGKVQKDVLRAGLTATDVR